MAERFLPKVTGQGQPVASAFLGEASGDTPARSPVGYNTINASASGDARQINGTIVSNFTGPIEKVEVYPTLTPKENEKQDYLRILRWLDPPDQSKIHNGAVESRQPDTGSWFLDGSDFKEWLTNPASVLWLYGGVGCGKTVLCSAIIETLRAKCLSNENVRLGFFYCSFRESLAQDLGSLLRVWIGQLCKPGKIPSPLRALHSKYDETYPPGIPTTDELSSTLIDTLSQSNFDSSAQCEAPNHEVYLIVDAIDEIPFDLREHIFQLLRRLRDICLQNVHILATSRDQSDIKEALQSWQRVVINKAAISTDISRFVSNGIKSHTPLFRQAADTREAIRSTIVSHADGMFLYASLQLSMLKRLRLPSPAVIRQVLEKLPKDLNDTYARILRELDEETIAQASSALKWLVASSRPLFIEELAEACGIRLDADPIIDVANRLEPRQLYQMLPDLIKIQPPLSQDGAVVDRLHTVSLAHFSVTTFLTESQPSEPDASSFHFQAQEAEELVAVTCLKYLYYFNRIELRHERFPLREYAWYNWENHIHVQGYKPRESAILRPKAVKLYQALGKRKPRWTIFDHRLDEFHYAMQNATVGFWKAKYGKQFMLPDLGLEDWKKSLMEALNVPYFYPNFDDFETGSDGREIMYSPLDTAREQIRLLTILPSLDSETQVRCRMTPVSLDDTRDYVALSYVWGSPEFRESLYVNGAVFHTTQNLLSILQNLRCHQESKVPHLWVDAICINQKDHEEKSHQVCLFGSIYGKAQEVVIALGDEHEYDETVIRYLEHLASLSPAASGNQSSEQSYSNFKNLVEEIQETAGWDAILDLFSRPWWQRVWTVQEVVLAANATIVVGNHSLNFTLVDQVVSCTEAIQGILSELNATQYLQSNPGWRSAMSMASTRRDFQSGQKLTLPVLLYRFLWQSGVDPRDKVYALLGLLGPDTPTIQVDYRQSTGRVFLDVALQIVRAYQNLDILSFYSCCDRSRGYFDLQSWVTDFAGGTDIVPITLGIFNSQNSFDLFTTGVAASEGSITWGDNLLVLRGLRFDSIERLVPVDQIWSQLLRKSYDPVLEDSQKPIGQSVTEVLWRTMLADQWRQGYRLNRERYGQSWIPPQTKEEERHLLREPGLQARMRYLRGRCMFITRRGYLGLGLAKLVEPGDSIAILEGGSVPYVLRKDGAEFGRYEFAGECYVHGIMDGEALAALDSEESDLQSETFWLR